MAPLTMHSHTGPPHTSTGGPDLSNPLYNGVALSELCAAICRTTGSAESRTEVKGVDGEPGRFVMRGTTLAPRCGAQAVHNVDLCLEVLKGRCVVRAKSTSEWMRTWARCQPKSTSEWMRTWARCQPKVNI